MVVDGRIGFTGGMNIREDFVLDEKPKHPAMDLHFRIEGPVVQHLHETFAEDWEFTTGESLDGARWLKQLSPIGGTIARGIVDGPDADLDVLNFTLMGAISSATRSVKIITPYFLPDQALVYALNTAALGGLDVDIVVPEKGNLKLVNWAMGGADRSGSRTWVPHLAFTEETLRSHQAHGSGRLLGLARVDQLGPEKLALELRVQRRML